MSEKFTPRTPEQIKKDEENMDVGAVSSWRKADGSEGSKKVLYGAARENALRHGNTIIQNNIEPGEKPSSTPDSSTENHTDPLALSEQDRVDTPEAIKLRAMKRRRELGREFPEEREGILSIDGQPTDLEGNIINRKIEDPLSGPSSPLDGASKASVENRVEQTASEENKQEESPTQRFASKQEKIDAFQSGEYQPKTEGEKTVLEYLSGRQDYDKAAKDYYSQYPPKSMFGKFFGAIRSGVGLNKEHDAKKDALDQAQARFESASNARQDMLQEKLNGVFEKSDREGLKIKPEREKMRMAQSHLGSLAGIEKGVRGGLFRRLNPFSGKMGQVKLNKEEKALIGMRLAANRLGAENQYHEENITPVIQEALQPKSGIGKWWSRRSPMEKRLMMAAGAAGAAFATGGLSLTAGGVATLAGRMVIGGAAGRLAAGFVSRIGKRDVTRLQEAGEKELFKRGIKKGELAGADVMDALRQHHSSLSTAEKRWGYASTGAAVVTGFLAGRQYTDIVTGDENWFTPGSNQIDPLTVQAGSGDSLYSGAGMFEGVRSWWDSIWESGFGTGNVEYASELSPEWIEQVRENPITIESDGLANGEIIGNFNPDLSNPDFIQGMEFDEYTYQSGDSVTNYIKTHILEHDAYGFLDESEKRNIVQNFLVELDKDHNAGLRRALNVDDCLKVQSPGFVVDAETSSKLNMMLSQIKIDVELSDGTTQEMSLTERPIYLVESQREHILSGNYSQREFCYTCPPAPVVEQVATPVTEQPIITGGQEAPELTQQHEWSVVEEEDEDWGEEPEQVVPEPQQPEPFEHTSVTPPPNDIEELDPVIAPDNPGGQPARVINDPGASIAPDNPGGQPARSVADTVAQAPTGTPPDNSGGQAG